MGEMSNDMGKHVAGGGRATATARVRTAEVAAVATEYRDVLERQVRVRTEATQAAYNVWRELGTSEARSQYRQALRLRDKTIDRYEKAVERSNYLNVTMNGR